MKTWTRPTKSFLIAFCFFGSLAVVASLDKAYIIAAILGLLTAASLVEYVWDTTIALHHFKKSLAITGQHWNRLANADFSRKVSRAMEENILSGAEKTILRLKRHSLKENNSGELEIAHLNG